MRVEEQLLGVRRRKRRRKRKRTKTTQTDTLMLLAPEILILKLNYFEVT